MKCPKCGYFDSRWLKAFNDRYLEYAKLGDCPEFESLGKLEVRIENGIAYWRTKKYVYRLPEEIYRVEGRRSGQPKGYWDASNFDNAHHRKYGDMTKQKVLSV